MRRTLPILAALTLLAACDDGIRTKSDTAAAGFEPPAAQRPEPIAGQAQTTPLSAYVGHYPDEPVGGVEFFDRTEVATALEGAVTDAALRRTVVRNAGPRTPIFQVGGRIASWGCTAHDCAADNWTLLVDPASGKGELCRQVGAGDRSRWYAGGPPVARPGGCPSERRS